MGADKRTTTIKLLINDVLTHDSCDSLLFSDDAYDAFEDISLEEVVAAKEEGHIKAQELANEIHCTDIVWDVEDWRSQIMD